MEREATTIHLTALRDPRPLRHLLLTGHPVSACLPHANLQAVCTIPSRGDSLTRWGFGLRRQPVYPRAQG